MWSSNRRYWWGYVPDRPQHGWRGVVDCLWFKGAVQLETGMPARHDDDSPRGRLMRALSTLLISLALALVILALGTMPMWLRAIGW